MQIYIFSMIHYLLSMHMSDVNFSKNVFAASWLEKLVFSSHINFTSFLAPIESSVCTKAKLSNKEHTTNSFQTAAILPA